MDKEYPFAAFARPVSDPTPLRRAITAAYRRAEPDCLAPLLEAATLPLPVSDAIRETAKSLVTSLRTNRSTAGVEGLVQEYSLSSDEGVALMCLAEALLRIPDDATRDALIRDKIADGNWGAHLGGGKSLFVNAATWGLVVTGKLTRNVDERGLGTTLSHLIARAGEPVIRKAINFAMRLMGQQFVMGETIDQAVGRARAMEARGFRYSYDMLGEAATTAADAERYFSEYERAVHAIGDASNGRGVYEGPGISIKLSALHPRYVRSQSERILEELLPRVRQLALIAKRYDIGFNIDAEEMDRLELSLDLFESLALDDELSDWNGLGFVVQAYSKRCPFVIDWVVDLAKRADRRIMVRLVKGAYWDAEIKRAQVEGLRDFPVYTRKVHTDVSYIACAKKLLDQRDFIFPQFATHNAQTLATIYHLAGSEFEIGSYEFQCLHGMGEPLYNHVVGADKLNRSCRVYAPVGTHETLLPYLVRRLLENGANSSFVNRVADSAIPVGSLTADPADIVRAMPQPGAPHDKISLPEDIYPDRRNSGGIDLSDEFALAHLTEKLVESSKVEWRAEPTFGSGIQRQVLNPADHRDVVGVVVEASPQDAVAAVYRAAKSAWGNTPVGARATILEIAANRFQSRMPILMGLLMREAGKSATNAIAEVREAIDFLRYYALQARSTLGPEQRPLGPFVCISPWNFPLAIFTGQVAAALAAGNPVLAKPAGVTPLIAAEAVRLIHDAGVPRDALQLMTGSGALGAALIDAAETAGVMFTGSTEVARLIQSQLSRKLSLEGRPIPLIAETGGQNAMIVDSSALAEQVVTDVLISAFDSAGQRCSALRVLCLQEEVADRTLEMLKGAMRELRIGAPTSISVDVGPVISKTSQHEILSHIETLSLGGARVEQIDLPADAENGTFVPPTIIEIGRINDLEREIFGPVLHVIRFKRENIDRLVDEINETGYGLTFGLHTRLDDTVRRVTERIKAGNLYINRNTIGAIVGVQPFGGRGLSGTGPKAGGPLYLGRIVTKPPQLEFKSPTFHKVLESFAEWLDACGELKSAATARQYAKVSPLGTQLELPGPVGERNIYSLRPRGSVLMVPKTKAGLYEQMAAVLATGNCGFIRGLSLPNRLPIQVAQAFAAVSTDDFSVALVEGDEKTVMAAIRDVVELRGPIVSVQAARPGETQAYDWQGLMEEVVVSINTTAAGGNASLVMID
jgi:RHH-type proline utilization regulon transcriptional repressor/proline dehydrogenase/delta 1-pyrroline-5-carboxylate dehydrogenase